MTWRLTITFVSAQRQIIEMLARETKITKEVCKKIIKYCKSYMVWFSMAILEMFAAIFISDCDEQTRPWSE